MIRSLSASLLLCLLAVPAFAQDISVRSGEHGSFTRLALDIPADLVWRLEQVEAERVTLHFERDGSRTGKDSPHLCRNIERPLHVCTHQCTL